MPASTGPGGPDRRTIFLAQAVRAAAYGFGAMLLGAGAAARGWSPRTVGLLLTAVVAGTALASIGVGAFAERLGRRRCYGLLYGAPAITGLVFGLTDRLWPLVAAEKVGQETVTYVANIYKYYIAYQLVTQAEAQKREAREQIQKPAGK